MHSVGKGQKESQWPLWHRGAAGMCLCRYQQLLKGLVWPRGFVVLMMHKRSASHNIYRLGAAGQMLAGRSEGY